MPMVAGESLRLLLLARGRLDTTEALRIWRDVLDAISHAHASGVVHRDIKPANILLSGRHALVTDFGIASAVEGAAVDGSVGPGVVVGTPAYMAPELRAGVQYTNWAVDIYQAGLVMYEMLAGFPSARGSTAGTASAEPDGDVQPLDRDDIPEWLVRLVMQCLEQEPAKRPVSADAVLIAIDQASSQPDQSRDTRAGRAGRRRMVMALAAIGALVTAGAIAVRNIPSPGSAAVTADAPAAAATPLRGTSNAVAWEWYQRGSDTTLQRNAAGRLRAAEYFRNAVAADPNFAAAHAGLATTYQAMAGSRPPQDPERRTLRDKAWDEARLGVRLDDADPNSHLALGSLHLSLERDMLRAEAEILRAIELDPQVKRGYETLALLYMFADRPVEQLAAAEAGLRNDPLSTNSVRGFALALALNGRCEESWQQLQSLKDLDTASAGGRRHPGTMLPEPGAMAAGHR